MCCCGHASSSAIGCANRASRLAGRRRVRVVVADDVADGAHTGVVGIHWRTCLVGVWLLSSAKKQREWETSCEKTRLHHPPTIPVFVHSVVVSWARSEKTMLTSVSGLRTFGDANLSV